MDLFPRRLYFDDMFDDVMPRTNAMKCDIYEEDGKYHIEMDLPGFDKKDIDISADNGYVTISAKHEVSEDNDNKKYIRRERMSQEVTRRFYLEDAEEDSIKAKFENGTLHITASKKEEEIPEKKTILID